MKTLSHQLHSAVPPGAVLEAPDFFPFFSQMSNENDYNEQNSTDDEIQVETVVDTLSTSG